MITGERKKFGLRPARKATLVDGLSNTVIIYEHDIAHYCFIAYAPALPAAIGQMLPRGLLATDPVFLQVTIDPHRSKWIISACNLRTWEQQPLWESATRPAWIKEIKSIRHNNDNYQTTHRAEGNSGSNLARSGRRIIRTTIGA